jgi:TonB family protein
VPQVAAFGFRGHVDIEFTVEKNGSMSALRMLKSSGTTSLDRASQNALAASHFKVLPKDYSPERVTMQVPMSVVDRMAVASALERHR